MDRGRAACGSEAETNLCHKACVSVGSGQRVLAKALCLSSRSLAAAPSLVRSVPSGLAIGHPKAPGPGSQGPPAVQEPSGYTAHASLVAQGPRSRLGKPPSRQAHRGREHQPVQGSWLLTCSWAREPGSSLQPDSWEEEAAGDPETQEWVLQGLGLAEASVYRYFSGTRDWHLLLAT